MEHAHSCKHTVYIPASAYNKTSSLGFLSNAETPVHGINEMTIQIPVARPATNVHVKLYWQAGCKRHLLPSLVALGRGGA